eukprot:SAG31_NODE_11866_length_990_cov_1.529742_2_plen_164_part_00
MGGGTSKAASRYEGSEAGIRKKSRRDLAQAAEALAAKLERRGLQYENEEDEIRFMSALARDDPTMNDRMPMKLQISEQVRLAPAAAAKHIRSEDDRKRNADPDALVEIVHISDDGARVQVKERDANNRGADPTMRGLFWYSAEELERPPEPWSLVWMLCSTTN